MNLLIDIGNSNFKWCFSNERVIGDGAKFILGDIKSFQYSIETLEESLSSKILNDNELSDINAIYVCCVAEQQSKTIFSKWVNSELSVTPIFFESSSTQFGVENAYDEVSNLGSDRWLSLIYVHHFYQSNVCVIDCGTAITVDVVLKNGQHQGGLIAPGFNSLIAGLDRTTSIVNDQNYLNQKTSSLLQQSTHQCIEQGCRKMSLGFIKDVVAQLKVQYGDTLVIVVTGGDSDFLASDLPENWHYCHDLIFRGLQFISENTSELD